MHPHDLTILVNSVQQPWFWDFGNKVLYDLCRKHPQHSDASIAAAKIWLIGRSYAAAIERRRLVTPGNFYRERVAPALVKSKIDEKLLTVRSIGPLSERTFQAVVETHKYVTDLFSSISGQEKRSLASKYLHFHAPKMFFIFDSEAVKGMRHLSGITGRAGRSDLDSDNDYRKFAEKCLRLRVYIRQNHGVTLTPRQIDRLLLLLAKK